MAIFTINTNSYVNQPPDQIGDGNVTVLYGVSYTFDRGDFTTDTIPTYSDPEGDAADSLKILSLPSTGSLENNSVAVVLNQEISFTDIDNGLFKYIPDNLTTTAYNDSFTFDISDVGSNSFSGITGTMTEQVQAYINQPPSSVGDNTVSNIDYNNTYTFTIADFTTGTTPPYADPESDPAYQLQVLTIPDEGALRFNGVQVIPNQIIDFTDIGNGLLTFVATGLSTGYTTDFTFAISDTGSNQFTS